MNGVGSFVMFRMTRLRFGESSIMFLVDLLNLFDFKRFETAPTEDLSDDFGMTISFPREIEECKDGERWPWEESALAFKLLAL